MRNIVLYIATSLDGFIATREGKVDWLIDPGEPAPHDRDYGYYAFYDSVDVTLMGYNTYRQILDFGGLFPYPEKTNYVFSKRHKNQENQPVEFVSSEITDFARNLREVPGKDIWLVGGTQINQLFLNEDLIDELIVSVQPVVLGEGLPLFGQGTQFRRFRVSHTHNYYGSMAQITMIRR
jgi:dihydrofolate reductase